MYYLIDFIAFLPRCLNYVLWIINKRLRLKAKTKDKLVPMRGKKSQKVDLIKLAHQRQVIAFGAVLLRLPCMGKVMLRALGAECISFSLICQTEVTSGR